MLRHCLLLLCVLSLAFFSVGPAFGVAFVNLSAMAPLSYYNAIPEGINTNGVVTMQGYSTAYHANNNYYHTYLYTGGTAGTLSDITSKFTTMTTANAMNANGQMSVEGLVTPSGYLYSGGTSGTVTSYKYGTSNTVSLAINANGDEAGYYVTMNPFVYTGGTAYALNYPSGDVGGYILALNTSGQAVGGTSPNVSPSPPNLQAAVWNYAISGGVVTSQTATNIGPLVKAQFPTSLTSCMLAINSSGIAVGSWTSTYTNALILGGVNGSFTYNVATQGLTSLGGLLVGLPFPGSLCKQAGSSQAINDAGVVVGAVVDGTSSSGYHAAIWESGVVTDLNARYASILPSGFYLDNATAIDNNGDIAGYGHDASSHVVQAFVIYVPEPGTLVLLAAAFAGLLTYAWRKRK
jgi:hypothetical protein